MEEKSIPTKKELSTPDNKTSDDLAVILVRGTVKLTRKVKDTLLMLRLHRKNQCVIIKDNEINQGMLQKVKDYVTWGKIDQAIFKELVEKRGEEYLARTTDTKKKYTYKTFNVDGKNYKPCFRLNPPKKGFGRKGIKVAFKAGGALGYRGEKINDLIKRML